jgi:hypothetical protein
LDRYKTGNSPTANTLQWIFKLENPAISPKFGGNVLRRLRMSSGAYVLLAVLVLSAAFGIFRKLSDGKLRGEIVPPLQGLTEHLHLDHDHHHK